MTLSSKIFYNTFWQVVIRGVDIIIGIVTLGLITRYLGQTGFGYYTTVMAFLQVFMMLADFGLYLTLLREISAQPAEKEGWIVNQIFTLRVASSAIFLALTIVAVQFFPYPAVVKQGVAALALSFFFATLITVMTALFQKKLAMPKVALVNLGQKVFLLLFVVMVIFSGGTLIQILISGSAASGLAFLGLYFFTRRQMKLQLAYDRHYWLSVLKKTWPLAATIALNLLYFKADTVILSLYRPASEVGLYGAPYRVLEIITTFPHMFLGLILPLLTAAWVTKNQARLQAVWQKSFDFFSFLALPLVGGTLVVATPLMTLVAGSEFSISGPILKILILATAAIFYGNLFLYLVLAQERQHAMVRYFALAALLALVGYFVFIPRYGYWAAAWVTVAVELLITVWAGRVSFRDLTFRPRFDAFTRLLAASLLMTAIIWPLRAWPVVPLIILAAAIYISSALLFRGIRLTEIKQLITSR